MYGKQAQISIKTLEDNAAKAGDTTYTRFRQKLVTIVREIAASLNLDVREVGATLAALRPPRPGIRHGATSLIMPEDMVRCLYIFACLFLQGVVY